MEAHGAVTIQVTPPPSGPAPTYALAWIVENGERKESAGFQKVRPDGFASFTLLADRTYHVGAFTDENHNGHYDAGEPLAFVRDVKPLLLSDPHVKPRIRKLTLEREHGLPPGTVIAVPKKNKKLGAKLNAEVGDVVSLDEERFAADAGSGGVWRPLDFLTTNTVGIYFTEKYDPKRIPVLFVYGIGGSPQDWRYLIDHFDKKRYQCWFLHYPSGMRLGRLAQVAATELQILKERYGFAKCYVVAHSMGGLVARATINNTVQAAGTDFLPIFVSISTPWAGHNAASTGVRHLKKPVPSWLDVAPDSDFLTSLYATPLPKGTRHFLIYGSKPGGPFWLKGENDGVVTVASETDPRIKENALVVHHLPYDHVEILGQQRTLNETLQALDSE